MGSTRSPPPSTLDSTYYTQSLHSSNKYKSRRSSPPPDEAEQGDYDNNLHTSSLSRSKKKKKKSKKERHDHHNHHHSSSHDYNDSYHDRNGREDLEDDERSPPPPPPQQPTQTLPRIKISLKLLPNPTIVPQPTASTSTTPAHWSHSTSNKASGMSKKKRRSSEQISVVSEDDEGEERDIKEHNEYSYDDQHNEASPISHRKKKKHKHKHKHRHPKHDDEHEDEDDTEARHGYHHQNQRQQAPENDDQYREESDDGNDVGEVDNEDTTRSTNEAAKITLRLGKMGKKKKSSHRTHHHHQSEEMDQPIKARSRSRSVSQHASVVVKQEEAPRQPYYQNQSETHAHTGQKRPFSSLQSLRSESIDTDMADQMTEDDHDDPLAGELDEPEDYDEEEEEDDDDAQQNEDGEQDESEDEDMSSQVQYGSKSVKSAEFGSKTVPGAAATSAAKLKKPRKPKLSKEVIKREGSATAPSTATTTTTPKSGRKGKATKRLSTPKTSTPTVPKKKELSVVCHKLLDHFVRKDSYDMFTQPVDPVLVPDYSSVIKNPMDLSTMRAKVERNFYPNIDEFLKDFKLVCDNARLYNAPETLYWRQANRLWEWGSKAIERERKSVLDKEEELLRTVKDEETLDIGGMGDYNNTHGHASRASVVAADASADSPISVADSRSHTPQQYRKAKKIKLRRDGTIAFSYSTDGSIDPASHPDPWSLIPIGPEFGAAPAVCPLVETNIHYNGQYLDDYPYWRAPTSVVFRSAHFQDYGPYAVLEKPNAIDRMNGRGGINTGVQNIPAYTGMVFGDEKGEAYVRSLAMFLDGIVDDAELAKMDPEDTEGLLQIKECVQKKVEVLTRGASTIVDKVATVVREEKSGKLISEIDTRVPMAIWKKEFETEEEAQQESNMQADNQPADGPVDSKDVEMNDATSEENEVKVKDEPRDEIVTEDVNEGVKAGVPPPPEPEMIDIRQVVRDIKAWPELKNRRKDYTTWKTLKIELNSLLPPSPQQQPGAAVTAEDEVQVKWGERWTGDDSEESKKWVREYLEQNSDDMRKVVQVLAARTSSTAASATTTAGSDEQQEKALIERLIKNIRKRLAEMVQYVPLSEINPQALPPPKMPATPTPTSTGTSRVTTDPAPTTASNATTTSAGQPSTTSSGNSDSATATAVTTTATVSTPDTPGGGSSVSSLSSPGSASSP
ncbi:hypothetical protein BGZ51_002036 [Haplosporangium sp. Z 767]|nr:hypothetical protein BGZ51_002036 [Haplosporangium sp. Z 767]